MKQGNPYKFRLWFSNQNTELFNDRQKRMVYHFLGWGPRGCDSWNYRIALEFHCSKRTIRRDLRHLEKHALVDIRGALGKHRRIIAIPYPTRAFWVRVSCQMTIRRVADKFVHHQRRTSKTSINQQRNHLLYDKPIRFSNMESGKTPDSIFPSNAGGLSVQGGGCSSETSVHKLSYDEAQVWEQTRRKLIDQLVHVGHRRESAITLANIVIKKSIRQKG